MSVATAVPVSLLVEADHSAPVHHVSGYIGWTIGLAIIVGLIYWLMRQGWQWRRTMQSGLPELLPLPKHTTEAVLELEGKYLGSTTAENWLDRIVAHHLGARSLVELTLTGDGPRPTSSSRSPRCAARAPTTGSPGRSSPRAACWWSPGSTAARCWTAGSGPTTRPSTRRGSPRSRS